jgi:hypothetical protein
MVGKRGACPCTSRAGWRPGEFGSAAWTASPLWTPRQPLEPRPHRLRAFGNMWGDRPAPRHPPAPLRTACAALVAAVAVTRPPFPASSSPPPNSKSSASPSISSSRSSNSASSRSSSASSSSSYAYSSSSGPAWPDSAASSSDRSTCRPVSATVDIARMLFTEAGYFLTYPGLSVGLKSELASQCLLERDSVTARNESRAKYFPQPCWIRLEQPLGGSSVTSPAPSPVLAHSPARPAMSFASRMRPAFARASPLFRSGAFTQPVFSARRPARARRAVPLQRAGRDAWP